VDVWAHDLAEEQMEIAGAGFCSYRLLQFYQFSIRITLIRDKRIYG